MDETVKQIKLLISRNEAEFKYPLLFTITKSGKQRVWACWVDPKEPKMWCTDGEVGGKLKTPTPRLFEGNTIKSPTEQTEEWAQRKWIEKLDKGYKPSLEDEEGMEIYNYVIKQKEMNGGMNRGVRMWGVSKITTGTTSGSKKISERHCPMLAKKYKDHIRNKKGEYYGLTPVGKKMSFPCHIQPKLDGLRALVRINDGGDVILESRNGKDYMHLNHIRKEVKRWLTKKGCEDVVLDGEMYVHKMLNPVTTQELKSVERFQFLSRACKITRKEPHPEEKKVQFHIFDMWDTSKTFSERWNTVTDIFKDYDGDILKCVPTHIANNHDEIEEFMCEFVGETSSRQGYEYEGLMVRKSEALYNSQNTHCSDLLKYKRFEDEEWEIYDAEPCKGNQSGAIKWKLKKMINGKERKVSAKQGGDLERARDLMREFDKDKSKFIGKFINIRFNDRSKDDIPRFPSATAIPEDKF